MSNLCNIKHHVLDGILPDHSYFNYNLRPQRHYLVLSTKSSSLADSGFITRIIFENIYWCVSSSWPFYGPLSGTNRMSQYQKKLSPTHTYRDHQPSFICFLHLIQSIVSSLFNSVLDSIFVEPPSKTSLVYLLVSAIHFILHTFLLPIIVFFSQHTPIPMQPVLL